MNYFEFETDDKEWELLIDGIWIVILTPTQKLGGESNLCLFDSDTGNLLTRFQPAVNSKGQWDGFTNVWLKNGQIYTATWSGFEYVINLKLLELTNKKFKK